MFIMPREYMIIMYVWYKLFFNFFHTFRINFSTIVLMNRDLFVKTSIRILHAKIFVYACLVNENPCI